MTQILLLRPWGQRGVWKSDSGCLNSSTVPVFLRICPLLGAERGPKALGRASVRGWGCCWPGIVSSPCSLLSQAGRELQGTAQPRRDVCASGTISDPELPWGASPGEPFLCHSFSVGNALLSLFIFGFPRVSQGLQLILSFGAASWAAGPESDSELWVWPFPGELGFTGSLEKFNLGPPGPRAECFAWRDSWVRGRVPAHGRVALDELYGPHNRNHPRIL